MKINDLICSATLQHGQLVLDDGTYIDLHEVYGVLADLREYAVDSTLEGDELPEYAESVGVGRRTWHKANDVASQKMATQPRTDTPN